MSSLADELTVDEMWALMDEEAGLPDSRRLRYRQHLAVNWTWAWVRRDSSYVAARQQWAAISPA